MHRLLVALTALFLLVVPAPSGAAATADTTPPRTDPPITLAEGRSITECISAAPKPGCTTRRETDGHQLAVLGVMAGAIAFIGWRVGRGLRRNRLAPPSDPAQPGGDGSRATEVVTLAELDAE